MKNFKNFELNNTQQLNTFGQGRPDGAGKPDDVVLPELPETDAPDFVDTLPDAGQDNGTDAGNPSFTGKGKGRG